MIYSTAEISALVAPVAEKYGIRAVYLFGSYARQEATEQSDIDLLIDTTGSQLKGLLALGALYCELEELFQKKIDLITVNSLEQKACMPSEERFRDNVKRERVMLYEVA